MTAILSVFDSRSLPIVIGMGPGRGWPLPGRGLGTASPAILILFLCLLTLSPLHSAEAATTVTVRSLASLRFHPQHEAPANVLSLSDSPLSLEVTGIIIDIPIQVGQLVQKGELLVRLDPWEYKNQVQQAQAALEESLTRLQLARHQKDRTARLRDSGQASEELFEQRQAELQSLTAHIKRQKAARQAAQDRLERSFLKAPFSGVVVARIGQIGAWSAPGVPLLRLVDSERVELAAHIRPSQRAHFDQAWRGHFNLEGSSYPVRLRALVAAQDPRTRTQEARFVFVDDGRLEGKRGVPRPLPGAAGRLAWEDPRFHLPAKFLVRRDGTLGFFFAEGEKARFQSFPKALEGRPVSLETVKMPPQGNVILSGRDNLVDGSLIQRVPTVAVE